MKYVILNNNIKMPILGFGVYQVNDLKVCEQSVSDALEVGYRLIDTAAAYENEVAVGDAIRKSGIKREDLFITTKLWIQDAGYESAKEAFYKSLQKLQLDYLDLYLIHQPFGDYYGSWRAMEELYEEGLIKAIGVSNFFPDRMMDLMLNNKIKPALNQIELHPFNQQQESVKFLKDNGIQPQSWGPFAEGKNDIFNNEVLGLIAKKHGKSVAQIILRFFIEQDIVVIPKSVNKDRIVQNFDVFDFTLSQEDINLIKTLDKDKSAFFNHRDAEAVKFLNTVKFNI